MTDKIIMTGAAGGVAAMIRPLLKPKRPGLVLSDRVEPADLTDDETFIQAELSDMDAMMSLMDGARALIHLGGFSVEGSWDVIHESNIVGLYNTLEACRQQGVERFIFASSNHAVGFYPRRRRIGVDDHVRPDSRYGVSKAFGEAMGAFYADKFAMRVMSIRIGNVALKPADRRRLAIWLHPEDLVQLIDIGLDHPDLHNTIVYGASHCERAWWDNASAFDLGYQPKHNAEDHADYALEEQAKIGPDAIGDQFQGGTFCSNEFEGDLDRSNR